LAEFLNQSSNLGWPITQPWPYRVMGICLNPTVLEIFYFRWNYVCIWIGSHMVIILSDPSKNIWFQTELRSAMKFYACVWMLNTVLSGHPAISLYFSNCPIDSAWTAQEKKTCKKSRGKWASETFF